jgi:hypothetical protein
MLLLFLNLTKKQAHTANNQLVMLIDRYVCLEGGKFASMADTDVTDAPVATAAPVTDVSAV